MASGSHVKRSGGDPDKGAGDAASAGRGSLPLLGAETLFGGEDHFVVVHAPLAKLLADHPCQRTALGF